MSMQSTTEPTDLKAAAHETLVANLRNAHALEKQVITVLEGQIKLLGNYPEFHDRVATHLLETREHARRLETSLEVCGTSTSLLKVVLLSAMGLGQSTVQGFAEDAVLKGVAADILTEHLEIATYRSLIVLAELAGKSEIIPRLQQSLREEEAMAEWLSQNLEPITRTFIDLKAREMKAEEMAAQAKSNASQTASGSFRSEGQTKASQTSGSVPDPLAPQGASRDDLVSQSPVADTERSFGEAPASGGPDGWSDGTTTPKPDA